jgi:hypothetical protein
MSAMFHMHPVVAAMLVDRQRELEHNVRMRRLLEAAESDEQPSTKTRTASGIASVRPIAPRPAGPGGPACEAL